MTEWSYLYLAVPPALAVAYALLAQRSVAKSGKEIDALRDAQQKRSPKESPLDALRRAGAEEPPSGPMMVAASALIGVVGTSRASPILDGTKVERSLQQASRETGAFRPSTPRVGAPQDAPKAAG